MKSLPCEICGARVLLDIYDFHYNQCDPLQGSNNQQIGAPEERFEENFSPENNEFVENFFHENDSSQEDQYEEESDVDDLHIPGQLETYEDLLALDQHKVKVGMTKKQLEKFPLRTFITSTNPNNVSCNVCLCDFELGDRLRKLKCNHEFHIHCIDKWLSNNITCPVCKEFMR